MDMYRNKDEGTDLGWRFTTLTYKPRWPAVLVYGSTKMIKNKFLPQMHHNSQIKQSQWR